MRHCEDGPRGEPRHLARARARVRVRDKVRVGVRIRVRDRVKVRVGLGLITLVLSRHLEHPREGVRELTPSEAVADHSTRRLRPPG